MNDKTIIELGYRKISWFVSVSLRQIIDLLATEKSRYFAQPRPIIANYDNDCNEFTFLLIGFTK